jgi:hypothetical protein
MPAPYGHVLFGQVRDDFPEGDVRGAARCAGGAQMEEQRALADTKARVVSAQRQAAASSTAGRAARGCEFV